VLVVTDGEAEWYLGFGKGSTRRWNDGIFWQHLHDLMQRRRIKIEKTLGDMSDE